MTESVADDTYFHGDCGGAYLETPAAGESGAAGAHHHHHHRAAPGEAAPPPPSRFDNGGELTITGVPGGWVLASAPHGDLMRGTWTPLDLSAVSANDSPDPDGGGVVVEHWGIRSERELPPWESAGGMAVGGAPSVRL